jgi:uncharacterized protein (DUF1697 family)
MATWIVLIRGINVAGRNLVSMKELVADLEEAGFGEVRTYLQSGNVVLDSRLKSGAAVAQRVAETIETRSGFRPAVMVLDGKGLARIVKENPFPAATAEPKSLHVFFLDEPAPALDRAGIERLRIPSEAWQLTPRACYLHTPEGFGTSKLAARLEKLLGVPATARNWRTVKALVEMAG